MKKVERGRGTMTACEGGYEALQSMLKGEYNEESTGARTIRQTGGKDRHSKVFTARGPRDRRVRLSVSTAIRFYDLQDRLGFEQPSKAVEWLLLHCQPSIQALPQLASLHPMRAVTIPKPAYSDHHEGNAADKDENGVHPQKVQKSHIDALMHPNYRKQDFHHCKYNEHHHSSSLHNGPFPSLCTDNHPQDSIEEDLPQYSNPSSSGASSDHPISMTEVVHHQRNLTLADVIPIAANDTAPLTGMQYRCSSTSFAALPTIHMNKKHRIEPHLHNQAGHATPFASLSNTNTTNISLSIGRRLGINSALSSAMNASPFSNTASFCNNLMINDEEAMLVSNSLQGRGNEGMQAVMRLPNVAYKPNQYVDTAQLMFAGQANQLANDDDARNVMQVAHSIREGGMNGQACTGKSMNDNSELYNKLALQQVEELVCSNVYASPSPSESTSINTLAAAYSKAAHGGNNTAMVDDHQAANILYRPPWSFSSGL